MDSTPAMPRHALGRLVGLMSLEERARNCRSRSEAQDCIRKADATKRELWGTTEGSMGGHLCAALSFQRRLAPELLADVLRVVLR